jgi:hypothetical protein
MRNSTSATIAPLTTLTGPGRDRSVSLTRIAYPPGSNTRSVRADRVITVTHDPDLRLRPEDKPRLSQSVGECHPNGGQSVMARRWLSWMSGVKLIKPPDAPTHACL